MKRYKKYVAVILLICGIYVIDSNAQVRNIIGGVVDGTTPPAPTGLCGGTITMTSKGTVLSGVNLSGDVEFRAGSLENGFSGVGYMYGTSGGALPFVTRLLTFDLGGALPVLTGNVIKSTDTGAGGNPDLALAIGAHVYDSNKVGSGAFIVFGTQVIAPCTGGSINCLHIRSYAGTVTQLDIIHQTTNTASGFYSAFVMSDSSSYWVAYTSGGANLLSKLNSSLNLVTGTVVSTPNLYNGLASDGAFIYSPVDVAGTYVIRKVNVSTLVAVNVTTSPSLSSTVTAEILELNGFIYVAQTGALKKIRTSDMVIVGTVALTAGTAALPYGIGYDAANDKLYVVGASATSGGFQYTRIDRASFTVEQTLLIELGAAGAPRSVGFDFLNQHIWGAIATSTASLTKVNLCS